MNLAAAPPPSACQLGTEGVHGPDRISRSVYNLAGEVTQLQVAVGTAVQANEASFTYNLNGQRASVTDGEGNRAELRYDGHGRQNRWVFPSPSTPGAVNESDYEAYGYDAGGNRTSLRNRAGEVTAFSYDALNRMTLRDRPGSEPDVSYGHDNLGRMTSAAQPGHALSFAFDGFGRTTSESGPLGTMNHSYDIGGRRTLMNGPGGYSLFFSHLDTGEVSQVRDGGNGPIGTYSYDGLGRRSGISRPNGTTTSYGYDGAGRLSTLSHDLSGTAHDLQLTFGYNPAGQIVETTRSNDIYAFTGLTNQSRADSVNGLNQITQSGSATVTHDARGNTTYDGTRSFAYDSENRMTSGPGTTLSYDPLGRLYEISSGGMVRRFLHDGDNLIGEHDPATGWTAHHVSGPQVNDVLATYALPSTVRTFYYADERGSVIAHADNAGTTTQVNRYDEYGVPALTNAGRFQYTGHAWLPEIQLHYYRARIYNAVRGRFMQVDPVGYDDQWNLYAYVRNDPVNGRDPTGKRIELYGTRADRNELRAAILAVARSDQRLFARYIALRDSTNVHIVRFSTGNTASQSQRIIPHNAENGRGTSTRNFIDKEATRLDDGTPTDIRATIAHELFGHAYESDRGIMDATRDPTTGIGNYEVSASQIENIYREAAGMPVRERYGDRDIPRIEKGR